MESETVGIGGEGIVSEQTRRALSAEESSMSRQAGLLASPGLILHTAFSRSQRNGDGVIPERRYSGGDRAGFSPASLFSQGHK